MGISEDYIYKIEIINSNFRNNSANLAGGIIFIKNYLLNISESTFTAN
jgi:hypothetical protein